MQQGQYLWLIPSVAVYFLAVLVRTWRWDYLLRPLKRIPVRRLFPVVVIGYMGNNIFPFRIGELLRAYVLKRNEEVSISSSLATIVVERIFDGLTMLLFVFIALPTVPLAAGWSAVHCRSWAACSSWARWSSSCSWRPDRPTAARLYNPLIDHLLPHRYRRQTARLHRALHAGPGGAARCAAGLHDLLHLGLDLAAGNREVLVRHARLRPAAQFLHADADERHRQPGRPPCRPRPATSARLTRRASAVLVAFGVVRELATAYTLVLHAALWLPITLLGFFYMIREGLRWGDLTKAVAVARK